MTDPGLLDRRPFPVIDRDRPGFGRRPDAGEDRDADPVEAGDVGDPRDAGGGYFRLYAGEGLFKGDGTLGLVVVGLPAGSGVAWGHQESGHLPDGPCIGVWRGPEGYIQYKKVERAGVYTCSCGGNKKILQHRLRSSIIIPGHRDGTGSTVEDMRAAGYPFPAKARAGFPW